MAQGKVTVTTQDGKTIDPTTTAQVEVAGAFEDGMALALWLHSEVHPQLKRWGKSGDKRVKLMAAVISDLVSDAYVRQDWGYLNHMYDVWKKNEAVDPGTVVVVSIEDDEAPF
jgi:hypothetical protein